MAHTGDRTVIQQIPAKSPQQQGVGQLSGDCPAPVPGEQHQPAAQPQGTADSRVMSTPEAYEIRK